MGDLDDVVLRGASVLESMRSSRLWPVPVRLYFLRTVFADKTQRSSIEDDEGNDDDDDGGSHG